MPKFVGLIRGINVGGNKLLKMSDLRDFLKKIGCANAETLLQSGNFVFEGGSRKESEWESQLKAESAKRLKLDAEYFVRSAKSWQELIAENPFSKEAKSDPSHLLAIIFHELPSPSAVEDVRKSYSGSERFQVGKQALCAVFPEGMGRSKLSAHPAWKKLTTRGTARNWNTVLKLQELLTR